MHNHHESLGYYLDSVVSVSWYAIFISFAQAMGKEERSLSKPSDLIEPGR
jgi:hypothetical protein